jgi:hypothetical protein
MKPPQPETDLQTIERAIALATAALVLCDENGYVFAAIDLSSAIDKLNALKPSEQVN